MNNPRRARVARSLARAVQPGAVPAWARVLRITQQELAYLVGFRASA